MKHQTPLWTAIRKSLCPICRKGPLFQTFIKMHKNCPNCDIVYEREHGYFLNAIFVSYVLNGLLFAPIALYGYFTDQLLPVTIGIIIAAILLILPTFHYSRVLWMYMDQALDPRRVTR